LTDLDPTLKVSDPDPGPDLKLDVNINKKKHQKKNFIILTTIRYWVPVRNLSTGILSKICFKMPLNTVNHSFGGRVNSWGLIRNRIRNIFKLRSGSETL
jgi:hypothetical protein